MARGLAPVPLNVVMSLIWLSGLLSEWIAVCVLVPGALPFEPILSTRMNSTIPGPSVLPRSSAEDM